MEPQGDNRPTMETAREVGRQRIDKVINFISPLASPDILLQIGANAAQEKINDVKERVEAKATEIKDAVVEKVTDAYDRLENRYNQAKDKTVAVAKEISRRGKVLGLTPVATGEAIWAEIYQIPAGFREALADMREKKIENYKTKIKSWENQKNNHREKAGTRREKAKNMNGVRSRLNSLKTTG